MVNKIFFRLYDIIFYLEVIIISQELRSVKLRYCEKTTTKFEKIFRFFTCLHSNIKTSGRFFKTFVAHSEKLNFNRFVTGRNVVKIYHCALLAVLLWLVPLGVLLLCCPCFFILLLCHSSGNFSSKRCCTMF